MRTIKLSRAAKDFIERLQRKQARQIVLKVLSLTENPYPPDHKALRDSPEGYLRTDVGEFRIVYRVEPENVIVAVIGKRNDDEVYKRFKRKK